MSSQTVLQYLFVDFCFLATDGKCFDLQRWMDNSKPIIEEEDSEAGCEGFLTDRSSDSVVLDVLLCVDTYVCMYMDTRGQSQMLFLGYFFNLFV